MGAFFPFDSHPMAYFIIWEMHGFPYQFPTLRENVTKPTMRGEPGKLVLILFPQYGCLFSIFHFMVYFITSGMHVFSHQFPILREKTAKPIEWGKPRKLVFILFPQYGRFFPLDSHPMVYFIAWKMYGFFHQIFHSIRNVSKTLKWEKPGKLVPDKILQNPSYLENLGNWYSYFSKSKGAFFPLDSHPMVHFRICEIHGFSHQFPVA